MKKTKTFAAVVAMAFAFSTPAGAQTDALPAQSINIVVGYAAGGSTDIVARIIGKALSERVARPVIVLNKPGASGTTAAAEVSRAKGDSNTLLMFTTPMLLAHHISKDIRLDPSKDLAPVATIYDLPNVLTVNKERNPAVKNLQDLIGLAGKKPGGLNYGSGGTGSIGHMAVEDLKTRRKFEAQHIPYKGGSAAVADLLGGQIDLVNADLVAVLPHIRSGKLTALAVGTAQRVSVLPDTPTVAEQGVPGFTAVAWGGLMAPKSMPPQVVDRLSREIRDILKDEGIRAQLLNAGAFAVYGTPTEMANRLKDDDQHWGQVARSNRITAD